MNEESTFQPSGHTISIAGVVYANADTGDVGKDKEAQELNKWLKRIHNVNIYFCKPDYFAGFMTCDIVLKDMLKEIIKLKIEDGFEDEISSRLNSWEIFEALRKNSIIDEHLASILEQVNKLRNNFAHEDDFVFDENKMKNFCGTVHRALCKLNQRDEAQSISEHLDKKEIALAVNRSIQLTFQTVSKVFFSQHQLYQLKE